MSKHEYPGAKAGPGYATCAIQKAPEPPAEQRAKGKAEDDDELYEVSLSSEYEVERYGWFGGKWREVLDHAPAAVQLARMRSGRSPLLADHDSRQVIGVLSNPRIEDRVLRASARFSRNPRAQEIKRDIDDGIRTNSSVGYIPKRVKLVEENEEKGDLWRVLLWEPLEVSSVAIPADPSVGFGRSAEEATPFPVEVVDSDPKEVRSMFRDRKLNQGAGGGGAVADPPAEPAEPVVEVGLHLEHAEIVRVCERNGCQHLAAELIEKKATPAEVYSKVLEHVRTRGPATRSNGDVLKAVPEKDRSRYSYSRPERGTARRSSTASSSRCTRSSSARSRPATRATAACSSRSTCGRATSSGTSGWLSARWIRRRWPRGASWCSTPRAS